MMSVPHGNSMRDKEKSGSTEKVVQFTQRAMGYSVVIILCVYLLWTHPVISFTDKIVSETNLLINSTKYSASVINVLNTAESLKRHQEEEEVSKTSLNLEDSPEKKDEANQQRTRRATVAVTCDTCPQICDSSDDSHEITCTCFRGFKAVPEPVYCEDIDECRQRIDLCQPGGRCINSAGSYVCRCTPGYRATPDGRCVDINECANSQSVCSQICNNMPGQYSCSCYRGYTLLPGPGPGTCKDLNECEMHTDQCSHLCANTEGSYICRCPAPLQLAEDGHTCVTNTKRHRKSPPLPTSLSALPLRSVYFPRHRTESRNLREGRNFCQFQCLNGGNCKQGLCHCPSGLTGIVCENDLDECSMLPYDLKCAHRCVNTFGSFYCECQSGWILGADRRSCIPQTCIPACLAGGTCINGVCSCPPGLTGSACGMDEDECQSNPCEELCRNTFGSYVCFCRGLSRLASDGHSCLEPPCKPHCRNGGVCRSGHCVCKPGFHGRLCQLDINECNSQDFPCEHACVNSIGSYQCLCPAGFRLTPRRTTCEPNPFSDDQPRDTGQFDVIIEIVVHDRNSRMIYHTMKPNAVRLPWYPTSYPSRIHSNVHYQIIPQTELPLTNFKTDNYFLGPNVTSSSIISRVTPSHFINTSSLFHSESEQYIEQTVLSLYSEPSQSHQYFSDHLFTVTSTIPLHSDLESVDNMNKISTQLLQSGWASLSEDMSSSIINSPNDTQTDSTEPKIISYFPIEMNELVFESTKINYTNSIETIIPTPASLRLQEMIYTETLQEDVTSQVPHYSDVESESTKILKEDVVSRESYSTDIDDSTTTTENVLTTGITDVDISYEYNTIPESVTDKIDYPIDTDNDFVYDVLSAVNSNEDSSFLDPTPPNNISPLFPTAYDNMDLIREISNSLFPSHRSPSQQNTKTETQYSESENILSSSLSTAILVSSLMSESETLFEIMSSETPILSTYKDEINLEIASTTFHVVDPNTIVHSQTILPSSSDYTNKQNFKKQKSKKKKPRQRKEGKFGKDLQILNQILQAFDLQTASPGDGRKYEVIDFDEVTTSSINFATFSNVVPSVSSNPLPVQQVSEASNRKEMDCYYDRKTYKSRTTFYRDEKNCTKCVCKDGELRCAPRHCPSPHCEGPISGDCCDYCPGDCVVEQQVYLPGERFSPYLDPCRECRCENGRAVCHDVTCPALACPPQYRVQLSDECCPVCIPPEPGCFWNGRFFYTGQLWVHRQGGCQACLCKDKGEVQCNPVVCVVGCRHPQFVPGDCCPLCEGCQHHGQQYKNEEIFTHPTDPCSFCQCQYGNITCFENSCKYNCSHPFKRPGECCPKCSDCLFEGTHIKNSSSHIFTSNENGICRNCSCNAGEVKCQATECLPGCELEGGRHVASGKEFNIGSDPCTKCRCLEGRVECKAEPCPAQCKHGVLLPRACCLDCSNCEYKGRLYRDLEVFRSPEDTCLSCLCARGNVLCDNSCEEAEGESDEDEDDDSVEDGIEE